jgi:phosphoglycolate phosphatase
MSRLLVIFPGVGYHCDKPLLYYGRKLAAEHGYEESINLSFTPVVDKIRGNREKMEDTFRALYGQAEEALQEVKWDEYGDILFISKSIGTIIASSYIKKHSLRNVRQVLYTPLEDTFKVMNDECGTTSVAFIGTADPWSDVPKVVEVAKEHGVAIHVYKDVDHSLEGKDTLKNLEIIQDVMTKTRVFLES